VEEEESLFSRRGTRTVSADDLSDLSRTSSRSRWSVFGRSGFNSSNNNNNNSRSSSSSGVSMEDSLASNGGGGGGGSGWQMFSLFGRRPRNLASTRSFSEHSSGPVSAEDESSQVISQPHEV